MHRFLTSHRLLLALPIVAFAALALVETWPWALHPGSRISAPVGGDVSSSIAKFGVLGREHSIPWTGGEMQSVGFPDGLEKSVGIDAVSFLSATLLWLGSMVFGPIATHGIHAVLGYVLTATVALLFVRRVTGSTLAGTVAGFAYGFFPHMTAMAYAAVTYQQMWLFLLPMWALWEFSQRPSRRWAVLAGVAAVAGMFWTPYYAEHTAVVLVSGGIALALVAARLDLPRRILLWALAPVAAAGVAQVAIGALTGFEDQPARPFSDFYDQAAHPLMYVLPGFGSSWTRAGSGVTDWSYETLVDLVPRANQTNLYVGLSVLALAVVAVATVVVPWLRHRTAELERPALAGLLALAAVVGTFLFSLPPKISVLGVLVPLPGTLVFELAPGLRAGQRFVMPLMGGMAVLAGVGAWQLLRGLEVRRAVVVGLALCAVVVVDLRATFPGQWSPAPKETPAIRALAEAPTGPALQATPNGFVGTDPQRACLLQAFHHKPLFNTCAIRNIPENLFRIASAPACDALAELRGRGLRYVIQEPMRPDVIGDCMRKDRRLRGAQTLARDADYRIWVLPGGPERSSVDSR